MTHPSGESCSGEESVNCGGLIRCEALADVLEVRERLRYYGGRDNCVFAENLIVAQFKLFCLFCLAEWVQ